MLGDAIDWLNNNSGTVQAAAVVVLVVVTYFYMRSTGRMAKAAEETTEASKMQTEASLQMAKEMQEQRQDDMLPVIDLSFNDSLNEELKNAFGYAEGMWPDTRYVRLFNFGKGPAFDVEFRVKLDDSSVTHRIPVIPAGCSVPSEAPTTPINGFHIQLLENGEPDQRRIEVFCRDVYGRLIRTERVLRYHRESGHLEVMPLRLGKVGCTE